MQILFFIFGALLCFTGMVVYVLNYMMCGSIVDATSSDSEGLRQIEASERNLHNGKPQKTQKHIKVDDEELKAMTKKALGLQILCMLLFTAGIILIALGLFLR